MADAFEQWASEFRTQLLDGGPPDDPESDDDDDEGGRGLLVSLNVELLMSGVTFPSAALSGLARLLAGLEGQLGTSIVQVELTFNPYEE